MTLTITTNNVPRDIIDTWELTPAEREDFEYLDWAAIEDGRDSASFFRYKGTVYDLGDVPRVGVLPEDSPLLAWDGLLSDTFFSGIVVRYCNDHESVIVGRFYS